MTWIVSKIRNAETIAAGHGIRERRRLVERYGPGNWRKKKGVADVKGPDGRTRCAEVHWYEAHGIGRVKMKVKRWL